MCVARGCLLYRRPASVGVVSCLRARSERSFAMRGAGNAEDIGTRMANRTAPPVASSISWALQHDIEIILEQPRGSLLQRYTPYHCLLASMERHATDGRLYGWKSQKPFWLYPSNGLRADSFRKCNHIGPRQKALMVDGHGTTGMSASSQYAPAFARNLLRMWR